MDDVRIVIGVETYEALKRMEVKGSSWLLQEDRWKRDGLQKVDEKSISETVRKDVVCRRIQYSEEGKDHLEYNFYSLILKAWK